ncbi:hypothetical protein THC_0647 [Caldimicrobium thiodismutans]|uniref:ResB-like domain-containing protein n=1 Tax=Caldimicrobium thiodismutans TaxID=1653476 RepID=A0A0U5AX83_9BACT|nr:cytochrome c biogenesis protein ResB [Caldimicrobium thiodismutans]BAU23039.1 hypothetical protein THC_0647 [Caldimicrobium thiodismutans]
MKRILDELASARLAIVLFFVLAGISILGTIIPQGQPHEFYLTKYGQGLGKLILFFQIQDAYHSWWYISALFLFLANLIACSLKRLPFTLKLYKRDPAEVNPENLPNKVVVNLNGDIGRIKAYLQDVLALKSVNKTFEKGELFYKTQNRFSFFSVYVVHFSLVIVIIGALIGAFFGWRGNMNILEGETSNIVQPFRKKDPVQLDFSLKLNKFILETYPNGMPKEYISNVTVLDGNTTQSAIIKVNQPFKYKDVTFYQASYNVIPEFKVKVNFNGKIEEKILSPFNPLMLKERYSIALRDYGEAHGFIYLRLWILDEEEGQTREGMIISGFPPLEVSFSKDKFSIEYEDVAKLNYMTGLQAKRDPGNWVVYLGFILMMFGLFLVYYFDPKTVWAYLKQEEGGLKLILGAYAKRERESLRNRLTEIAEKIKKELSK